MRWSEIRKSFVISKSWMIVVTMQMFPFKGYSENTIGDWWKSGFVVFIGLLIKNVYLPFSNTMSLTLSGGQKGPHYQFFSCNFYKRRN